MTSTPSLNIWCHCPLAARAVAERFPQHRILHAVEPGEAEHLLAQADIIYGHVARDRVADYPRFRWIHIPNANYARYDRPEFWSVLNSRGAVLTNSSTPLADPCAQHVVAMMLSICRRLPQCLHAQDRRQWLEDAPDEGFRTLTGATGLLLGFGAIGRRVAELLAPYRMNLQAVRRTVRGDEPIPTFPESERDRLLPQADHIINVLPISAGTTNFLSADRLALTRKGAYIFNVGRGATLDQDALCALLASGHLAGAYVDVTVPEPLPADHPLWATPNLYITPHTASRCPQRDHEVRQHFLTNLTRYLAGQPLLDRVQPAG